MSITPVFQLFDGWLAGDNEKRGLLGQGADMLQDLRHALTLHVLHHVDAQDKLMRARQVRVGRRVVIGDIKDF